jgi:excisionase family DNA binding protein
MNQKFYSIPELSKAYSIEYRTIWNWIKKNQLKAYKVNEEIRIDKKDFKKLITIVN